MAAGFNIPADRQKYAAYLAPWAKEAVVSWSFLEDKSKVLRIYVDPAMARKDDLESAVQSYSLFFCRFDASTPAQADAEVRVDEKGRFGLFWKNSQRPLFIPEERPLEFFRNCEMVGRWNFFQTLDSVGLSELNRRDVILNVKRFEGVTLSNIRSLEGETVPVDRVILTDTEDGSAGISLSVEIKTHGYYVGVLYLGDGFSITKCSIDAGFAKDGQRYIMFFEQQGEVSPLLPVKLDPVRGKQGVTQIREYVKVFISKQPIDLDVFEQESIFLESTPRLSKHGIRVSEAPDFSEVTTITVPVTVTASIPIRPLQDVGADLFKVDDIPEGFKVDASIVERSKLLNIKDLGIGPPSLWDEVLTARQVFDTACYVEKGREISMLELTKVHEPLLHPLRITPSIPLPPKEAIIAIGASDGPAKKYLPVGYTNEKGEVLIFKIPFPTEYWLSNHVKDVASPDISIKIYFHRLRYPEITPSFVLVRKDLTSTSDPQQIQMALTRARNALLLVHGLAGNMEAMAYGVMKSSPLANNYDAILAYQYDPLQSDVTAVAKDLKQRMAQVGLTGEGVGRATCIVAHGTGGLLCRYLIEQEGIAPYIDHLVMVGTPQEGIDRAKLSASAVALMAQALNGPEVYKNYLQYLPFLAKNADWPALRQLERGSDFVRSLNGGNENRGGVEYRVVAGEMTVEEQLE